MNIIIKIVFVVLCIAIACKQKVKIRLPTLIYPHDMTVSEFLKAVKMPDDNPAGINVISIKDTFPANWIKDEDVDTLITLVKSKDKCYCALSTLSSYIPSGTAEMGGYAIFLLTAYRNRSQVNIGLYACPETDSILAEELTLWWSTQPK